MLLKVLAKNLRGSMENMEPKSFVLTLTRKEIKKLLKNFKSKAPRPILTRKISQSPNKTLNNFSFRCDVSDLQEVVGLAERVKKDVGMIDILVNNAGVVVNKRFLDHTEKDIRKLFSVNILSHFWVNLFTWTKFTLIVFIKLDAENIFARYDRKRRRTRCGYVIYEWPDRC